MPTNARADLWRLHGLPNAWFNTAAWQPPRPNGWACRCFGQDELATYLVVPALQNSIILSVVTVAAASSAMFAAPGVCQYLGASKIAGINARGAQQDRAFAGKYLLQHAFDVIVSVRGLLACLCGRDGVSHQKFGDSGRRFAFRKGKSQAVVTSLGAIGRNIQEAQYRHGWPFFCSSHALPFSPRIRQRPINRPISYRRGPAAARQTPACRSRRAQSVL